MAKEKKELEPVSAETMFEIPSTLEIDGKTYRFAPLKMKSLFEFVELLKETGENPLYVVYKPELTPKLVRLLEICFAPNHPEIKGEAILELFDADAIARIIALVFKLSEPKKA